MRAQFLVPCRPDRQFDDLGSLAHFLEAQAQGDPLWVDTLVELSRPDHPTVPAVKVEAIDGSRRRFLGYAVITPSGGFAPLAVYAPGAPHRAEFARAALKQALNIPAKAAA